jgi:hypothetical protein
VASVGYGAHARMEPMSVVLRETADPGLAGLQARAPRSGSSGPCEYPELSAAGGTMRMIRRLAISSNLANQAKRT